MEALVQDDPVAAGGGGEGPPPAQQLSKSARKKQQKLELRERRKAERKAAEKEKRKREVERKRREWDEKLAGATEEERARLVESRRETRRERVEQRTEERELKLARLRRAAEAGQKLVLDLEFGHLMSPNEIHSLVHQVMYCYAANGKSPSPVHLWLTGCTGEIEAQVKKLPGFENWIIEMESRSYIDALRHEKENMIYLTADAEVELHELDLKKIYIVGGLVDRNRWKGITLEKAKEQGIQAAKLPIGGYLKMSSSKVLTVNQVVEILLKFLETRDWKDSFFKVIPQRKICESGNGEVAVDDDHDHDSVEDDDADDELNAERKKMRVEDSAAGSD